MPSEPNLIYHERPGLEIAGDAMTTAQSGVDAYSKATRVFASHMANQKSLGYMHNDVLFATNGPVGAQVRGMAMNALETQNKGASHSTQRALDLSLEGSKMAFFVVDTSGGTDEATDPEIAQRVTASCRIDQDLFLRDESGNVMMGVPLNEDGSVPAFSATSDLQRVQLSSGQDPIATENITFSGVLPADNLTEGENRENVVDVVDSLGVVHQLHIDFTYMGIRTWKVEVRDSNNTPLTQDSGGLSWSSQDVSGTLTEGGCVMHFDEQGHYAGVLPADDTSYATWRTESQELDGSQRMMQFVHDYVRNPPNPSAANAAQVAGLIQACNDFLASTFTASTPEFDGATATIPTTGSTDLTAAQAESATALATHTGDAQTAFTALHNTFDAEQAAPPVYAEEWLGEGAMPVGSAPSSMSVDLSPYRQQGSHYRIVTPQQDGRLIANFEGVDVSDDGVIWLKYQNQASVPAFVLPVISYINNNGLEQRSDNTLIEGPNCGSYTLFQPTIGYASKVRSHSLTQSNVSPEETLMQTQAMITGVETNSILMKMIAQLQDSIITQLAQM
jgi:flagellar hook-basal body protein